MKNESIGFIGAGRITRIFLQAFQNGKIDFKRVLVCDTNLEIENNLKSHFPLIEVSDLENCSKQDIVVIALHPPVIMETLDKIAPNISEKSIIVSLAPKIKISSIGSKLKSDKIIRMIPNATSVVNKGYNPVCFSNGCTSEERTDMMELFSILGNTFEADENKLEAYAIVSAMAPTYFWFQWKKLYDLGAEIGLDKEEAKKTVYETLIAASDTLFKSGIPEQDVFDLIPVKPLAENEKEIEAIFDQKLKGLYSKLTS